MDPGANALVKAVVADFDTAEGRSAARDGLMDKFKGSKPAEIKDKCIETHYGKPREYLTQRRQGTPWPLKAGCNKSASMLPRHPRRVDFLTSAACR
jgi:hypothetical protein